MRLQQRLDYLGFTDNAGKALVVDGIVGPLTESAIRRFKSAIDPSLTDDPNSQTPELDDNVIRWLNSGQAPRQVPVIISGLSPTNAAHFIGTYVNAVASTNDVIKLYVDDPAIVAGFNSINLKSNAGMVAVDTSPTGVNQTLDQAFAVLRVQSIDALTNDEGDSLQQGLQEIGKLLSKLSQFDKFAKPLPIVGSIEDLVGGADPSSQLSLGQALNLEQLLSDNVFQPIADYFAHTNTPSLSDLISQFTDSGINISDANLSTSQIRFDVDYTSNVQHSKRQISLGTLADQLGLSITTPVDLDLQTQLHTKFTFGINLQPGLSPQDAVFIKFSSPLTATVDSRVVGNTTLGMNLGFLKLDADVSPLHLQGQIRATINDGNALTWSEASSQSLSDFVKLESTGTVTDDVNPACAILTTTTTLFGQTYTGTVKLDDANIFTTDPSIDPSGLNGLERFANLSSTFLGSALGQVGNMLDNLGGSSAFGEGIAFAQNSTVGDVLDLLGAWDSRISSAFQSSTGPVDDLQTFLGNLGSALSGGNYDPSSGILTLDLDLTQSSDGQQGTIGFTAGLGRLTNVFSSSPVSLQATAHETFALGIDLNKIGSGFTLNSSTLLANLNGPDGLNPGKGVSHVPSLNDLRFTLSNGATFDVSIDNKTTVGEVLDAINTAGPGSAMFVATFAADHLVLVDKTRGVAGPFRITGLNGSMAGMPGVGLGIFGSASIPLDDGSLEIDGAPLFSDSIANHVFLDTTSNTPTLSGTVQLSADDVEATASLGLASAVISGGTGTNTTTVSVQLNDPNNDGRITLAELLSGLSSIDTITSPPEVTGEAHLSLPTTIPWAHVGPRPVVVNWPDVTRQDTLSVIFDSAFDPALDISNLSNADIVASLQGVAGYLQDVIGSTFPFLNQQLPFGNQSIGDLLGLNDTFSGFESAIQSDGTITLDDLQDALEIEVERAFGTSLTTPQNAVKVSYLDNQHALKIGLNLGIELHKSLSLSLDSSKLGLDQSIAEVLGNLFAVNGSATLNFTALANLQIDVGIDLSDPAEPRPFLFSSTHASIAAKVDGQDLNFSAVAGPLGLQIQGGRVILDSDGETDGAPIGLSSVDPATQVWTSTQPHNLQTGDSIDIFSTGSLPKTTPGLAMGGTVFVRVINATQFKVYRSHNDALSNTSIPVHVTDSGQGTLTAIGPINSNDNAQLSVDLVHTDSNGRRYFSDLVSADLHSSGPTGLVHVVLPVSASGTSLGSLDWTFDVSQLDNLSASPPSSVPDFSGFDSLNLNDIGLPSMTDGWAGFFSLLDKAISSQALVGKIPLVGDQLSGALRLRWRPA